MSDQLIEGQADKQQQTDKLTDKQQSCMTGITEQTDRWKDRWVDGQKSGQSVI